MKYFNELPQKINSAFARFPLTSIWATLGSLFVMIIIGNDDNLFDDFNAELLSLSLGISWLIGVQFLAESLPKKKQIHVIKAILLVLLIVYYISLPDSNNSNSITYVRWFLLLLAGHVFVFFAPFTKVWNKTDFWNYLQKILIAIARSALFSLVIYAGLSLALLGIENLFNINIDDNIYGQLFVFCLGIINTFIYLSDFPKNLFQTQTLNYTKAFDVFLKFILIPILGLYLIIVYAYSIKILIAWELPKGWVSYLISILAIVGFIVQISIEPIRKTHQDTIIRKFFPVFYYLLIPLLILLFIAIYTRIHQYNFTENRYLLLILACWILTMSLYLLFSKNKKLTVLPISLCCLCLLASYGPWSAFRISVKTQLNEFKKLITKTEKGKNLISLEEAKQFRSIANYLKERDQLYLADNDLAFKTSYITNYYNAGRQLLDSIYGKAKAKQLNNNNLYYNNNSFYYGNFNQTKAAVNIQGYDQFLDISLNSNYQKEYKLSYQDGMLVLTKTKANQEIFQYNIEEKIKATLKKHSVLNNAPESEFVYSFTNNIGRFKILVKNLQIRKDEDFQLELNSLNAYIFISHKKF